MLFEIDLCRGEKAYINPRDVVSIEYTRVDDRTAAYLRLRSGRGFEVNDTPANLARALQEFVDAASAEDDTGDEFDAVDPARKMF